MYETLQTFTNGADGRSLSAGRQVTRILWLNDEQHRACVKEGSLKLIKLPEPEPKPDDLTLVDGITPERARLLNGTGIFTFADMIANDLTFLPGIGVRRAAELKRTAAGVSDAAS